MLHDPVLILSANASLQVLAAGLLGAFMLVPMQPWASGLKAKLNPKALLSAHLDWLMLAFMQWGAALVMTQWPHLRSPLTAWLLVFGGWANATPYLFRGVGINAFALAGGWKQRAAASLGGVSSVALLIAWSRVAWGLLFVG